MYNTKDHNNIHDLVQPHTVNSPSFSSYPRQKRRVETEAWTGGEGGAWDMVAVAAGTWPYTLQKQQASAETPRTYQRLVTELQDDKKTNQAKGFWESFIRKG